MWESEISWDGWGLFAHRTANLKPKSHHGGTETLRKPKTKPHHKGHRGKAEDRKEGWYKGEEELKKIFAGRKDLSLSNTEDTKEKQRTRRKAGSKGKAATQRSDHGGDPSAGTTHGMPGQAEITEANRGHREPRDGD